MMRFWQIFGYLLEAVVLLALFFFIGYVIRRIIVDAKRKKTGNYAPFVALPSAVVNDVIEALNLGPGAVFYDLGCGDGRVVHAVARSCPGARCFGIERGFLPYCIARCRTRRWVPDRVRIVHKDIFGQDLSDATHVFVYLFPALLDTLLPKLERELKKGAIVVSVDFAFSNKTPARVIELDRASWKLGRKIYVYRI